jgi:hypothetical protein
MRRRGYILVETLVALTVLSISAMGIQRVVSQATLLRGLAQDYGAVQLLADNMLSQLDLKYLLLHETSESGDFPAPYDRYRYTLDITRVDVPRPELPSSIEPERREELEKRYHGDMPKIRLEIFWERSNSEYSRVFETLLGPERLWLPPEGEANAPPPE